ncbi:MAG: hypothetical protein GX754_00355 [Clostridiaceae bacterium]|nr:hypothetical protein [Clostridiaceae bacterium]
MEKTSKARIDFKKLAALGKLWNNTKKEKTINKSDNHGFTSNNDNNNDKKTSFFSTIINNKKEKATRHHEKNNNHEHIDLVEKETSTKKAQNLSGNVQESTGIYNDYDNLEQVNSIYERYGTAQDGLNTVFIAETYLKTLPDFLPSEIKRKTVLDIIRSGGINPEDLLKDGEERKEALNNFYQKFSQTTERKIKELEAEIDKLTESIQANKKAIMDRNKLQEEQTALINYEFQRLQKIMKFLQGENE